MKKIAADALLPFYNPAPIVFCRGDGALLFDTKGKSYIDFCAGIATNSLGNSNKELADHLYNQAQSLVHVSNLFLNDQVMGLADKLTKITAFDQVFFGNSGNEAIEAAIKIARYYAYKVSGDKDRNKIISFQNAFHGRSMLNISLGGNADYQRGFGPMLSGIAQAGFNDFSSVEAIMDDNVAAVIVETIQGEGGINTADIQFLSDLKAICEHYGALLIFDEVQTGGGRTGYLFDYQRVGVEPDILCFGKGIGGGFPIAGVLVKRHVGQYMTPGLHGSTMGGNPLACSVATFVLDTITQPGFLQEVREKADVFEDSLRKMAETCRGITSVRGRGLLRGIQIESTAPHTAQKVQQELLNNGLVTSTAKGNVLRLTPPLNIDRMKLEEGIEILAHKLPQLL